MCGDVTGEVGERERKESLEALRGVVNRFLEGWFDFFDLRFSQYLEICQDELEDLIGNPDSSYGVENDGVIDDEYTYDISEVEVSPGKCARQMKKLVLRYHIKGADEGRTYVIHYVGGFADEAEIECPGTSGNP